MMCYRDKTFCSFWKECATPCGRALTEEVKQRAKRGGLFISQFAVKPDCFKSSDPVLGAK